MLLEQSSNTKDAKDKRRHTQTDQAKALSLILREEFGVPFVFYDALTGEEVWGPRSRDPGQTIVELTPAAAATLAAEGRAVVTWLPEGRYLLAMLLYESGKPILVAAGTVPSLALPRPEQSAERERLHKWVQAVADRLRLTDQLLGRRRLEEEQNTQITLAWETILTLDRLIRRLRIHKNTERNQKRILDAAFSLIGAQSLMWIPRHPDAPVLTCGEPCLAPGDDRLLAEALAKNPDGRPSEPMLFNRVQETNWGGRFPNIHNLLALEVVDQETIGWLVAVNKGAAAKKDHADHPDDSQDDSSSSLALNPKVARSPAQVPHNLTTAFRRADAALLMPFAGLLEMHARGTNRYQDLKELLVGLTRSLTSALDAKDSYTFGHSERVARIAVELGRELGLTGDELSDIYLTGLLHDVGKIGIRDVVLSKPGPLTPEEFEHIKQHVVIGYKILAELRPIRNLLPGVLYHHERYDGKGYPDGLEGENIPLLARILAVADGYDAMSTARPYRNPLPCRRVEEILLEGAGTQWDKRIIEAFMRCRQKIHAIRQQGIGESLCQAIDGALRTDDSSMLLNSLSKSTPAQAVGSDS